MDGSDSALTATEYVIQLQEGQVLQSQDLEQIVNLAIVNSTANQVYTLQDAVPVAAVVDIGDGTDIEGVTLHSDLTVASHQCEEGRLHNEGIIVVQNTGISQNDKVTTSLDTVTGHKMKDVAERQNEKPEQNLTDLGSETSVTIVDNNSSILSVIEDQKQLKAVKRKELTLLNRRLAAIPKRTATRDQDDVLVQIPPFTAETLKKCFSESRLYNKTRTIYDYLMYEKFPQGYTNNQKQALRDVRDNYIIVDKKLYYRHKKDSTIFLLLVVHDEEADLQLQILHDCHITKAGSHQGINRTIAEVKNYFYWHGLTEHVRLFVKYCRLCCLKQTMNKEREKLLQLNMQSDSKFGSSPEGIVMTERVDQLVNEYRRLQNNIRPSQSHEWLQKLKDEVTELNSSITLHRSQNLMLSRVITDKVSCDSNNIVIEPIAAACERSGNSDASAVETSAVDTHRELHTYASSSGTKETSNKKEELKMLETMLPRNRLHNHSRLIEEIIRTNQYPENLTSGQVIGLAQVKTHYIMINDELYRVFSKRCRMQNVAKVIHDDEPDLKKKIMKAFHVGENGKHHGLNRTISRLNETFFWQSMSMHIRIFLEYCPVCRKRRGLSKTANNYVADTKNISDICWKISTNPKDACLEGQDNLDLSAEDYQEVQTLAEEVKELNTWLSKNPTIKNEWEYMYETSSRSAKWYCDKAKHKENSSVNTNKDFVTDYLEKTGFNSVIMPDGSIELVIDKPTILSEDITSFKDEVADDRIKQLQSKATEEVTDTPVRKGLIPGDNYTIYTYTNVAKTETKCFDSGDDISWSVNLDDSADDSVDEVVVSDNNDDENTTNQEDLTGDNESKTDLEVDDVRDTADNNSIKFDDEVMKIYYTTLVKKASENLDDLEMESGCQKRKYLADLRLAESADCSKAISESKTKEDGTEKSLVVKAADLDDNTRGVKRSNRRLKSKVTSSYSSFNMVSAETHTDSKHHSDQGKDEDTASVGTVKCVSPIRKSARKRILTPKFSGFVKSRRLEALSVTLNSDTCSNEKSNKGKLSNDNEEMVNRREKDTSVIDTFKCCKSITLQERQSQKSPSSVEPIDEKVKYRSLSLGLGINVSNAEPVMMRTRARNVTSSLSEINVDTNRMQEATHIKNNERNRSGSFSNTKSKGIIMKNSDVHVVKRKMKGKQSTQNSSSECMSLSAEGNIDQCCEISTFNKTLELGAGSKPNMVIDGPETKAIMVPRTRKGVMTKNAVSIMKQTDTSNMGKSLKIQEENKKTMASVCTEKLENSENHDRIIEVCSPIVASIKHKIKFSDDKLNENDDNLQRNSIDTAVMMKSSALVKEENSMAESISSRGAKYAKIDNFFKDENYSDIEKTKLESVCFRNNEIKVSKPQELHMKYNVDFKNGKNIESHISFQKKYHDFISLKSKSEESVELGEAENVAQEQIKAPIDASDSLSSAEVWGKQDMPASIKIIKKKTENTLDNLTSKDVLENISAMKNSVSLNKAYPNKLGVSKDENPIIIINFKTKSDHSNSAHTLTESDLSDNNLEIVCQKKTCKGSQNAENYNFPLCIDETGEALRINHNSEQSIGHIVGRTFDCPLCMKSFEDEKSYFLHKDNMCNLTCSFCGLEIRRLSKDKNNFTKHVNRHETDVNYQCLDCDKLFWNESLLHVHSRTHADEGMINCAECSEKFYSFYCLSVHYEAQHRAPLVHICDVCSARYGSSDFLTERQLADGVLSFYSCALCESKI